MTKEITGRISKVVQDDVLHGDHGYVKILDQFDNKSYIIEDLGPKSPESLKMLLEDINKEYERTGKPIHASIVFSHLHSDHTGGLEKFLEDFCDTGKVILDNVYLPELLPDTKQYYDLLNKNKHEQLKVFQEADRRSVLKTFAKCQLYSTQKAYSKELTNEVKEMVLNYNKSQTNGRRRISYDEIVEATNKLTDNLKKDISREAIEADPSKYLLPKRTENSLKEISKDKKMSEKDRIGAGALLGENKITKYSLEKLSSEEEKGAEREVNDVLNNISILREKSIHFDFLSKNEITPLMMHGVSVETIPFNKNEFKKQIESLGKIDNAHKHLLRKELYLDYKDKELERDEKNRIINSEENRKIIAGRQWDAFINRALTVHNKNKEDLKSENLKAKSEIDKYDNMLAYLLIYYTRTSGENMNNIITRVSDKEFTATFMGDCELPHEYMLLKERINLVSDYVKTGHHESLTSNDIFLLDYIKEESLKEGKYPYLSASATKDDANKYIEEVYSLESKTEIEQLPLGKTYENPITILRDKRQTKIIDHDVIEFHTNEMKRLNKEASDRSKTPTERLELLDKANEHLEKIEKGEPIEEYISRKFNCSLEKNEEKAYFQER